MKPNNSQDPRELVSTWMRLKPARQFNSGDLYLHNRALCLVNNVQPGGELLTQFAPHVDPAAIAISLTPVLAVEASHSNLYVAVYDAETPVPFIKF